MLRRAEWEIGSSKAHMMVNTVRSMVERTEEIIRL